MNQLKRHWAIIISNFAILLGVGGIACLIWFSGDWFFAGSRETFGPLNSYIFIWVSIAIAAIAALNAGTASIIASRSLRLTRATTRPFLNVADPKLDI